MSFMIWGLWIEISLRWKLEKSPSVTPMVFPCFNCSIIAFFPGGFCHGRWCWVHCIGHSRGSGGSALARFRIADWQDFSGFPWFSENTELIWSRIIIIYYHILSYIIIYYQKSTQNVQLACCFSVVFFIKNGSYWARPVAAASWVA